MDFVTLQTKIEYFEIINAPTQNCIYFRLHIYFIVLNFIGLKVTRDRLKIQNNSTSTHTSATETTESKLFSFSLFPPNFLWKIIKAIKFVQ